MMFRKLRAHAPFDGGLWPAIRNGGNVALDCGGVVPPGWAAAISRRPARRRHRHAGPSDRTRRRCRRGCSGQPARRAARSIAPGLPIASAAPGFPDSTGAQMGREGAVSVGGAHRLVPWSRLLNLCLCTHDREPSRSPTVPLFAINFLTGCSVTWFTLVVGSVLRRRRQGAN